MAASNINRVTVTGNLTADPDLRSNSVCKLRIAVNTRRKDGQTGQWVDKPNYFDVTVFGAQGENCARFLSRGRPVAIDGRLEWREWTTPDNQKRQAVEIVADTVQFLGTGGGQQGGGGGGESSGAQGGNEGSSFTPQRTDVPADTSDFAPAGAPAANNGGAGNYGDDDIPF